MVVILIRYFFYVLLFLFNFGALALNTDEIAPLKLEILVSSSPKFIKEWVSTPPEKVISVNSLRKSQPNQTIYIAFIASGYAIDRNGMVDLVAHWSLLTPNGNVLFSERNYAFYNKKIRKPGYVMLDPALDIVLDKEDSEGMYKIIGILEDRIGNTKKEKNYIFIFKK